jgi:hypothetical protein
MFLFDSEEIKSIAKIPTKVLIQIYDSMVCSIFNYASSVWQIGNTNSLEKISYENILTNITLHQIDSTSLHFSFSVVD